MSSPGLARARYCNPRSYVVQADLVELGRDLSKKNAAELWQRARPHELGPTAWAIAAVLFVFRGLRRGPHGCAVQAPIEAWARLLGKSVRQVQYAFAQLEAAGWAVRRRRLVRHQWTDENGIERQRCDVHAAAYLLPKGAARIGVAHWRRGSSSRAVGLLATLLRTCGEKLRVLHRRVTDALADCTPSFGEKRSKSFRTGKGARAPMRAHSTADPEDGTPRTLRHQEDQRRRRLKPQGEGAWSTWPELWERFERAGDVKGQLWLQKAWSKLELERLVRRQRAS